MVSYIEQEAWLLAHCPCVEHCSVPFSKLSLHAYCVPGTVLGARNLYFSREHPGYEEVPRRLIWMHFAKL